MKIKEKGTFHLDGENHRSHKTIRNVISYNEGKNIYAETWCSRHVIQSLAMGIMLNFMVLTEIWVEKRPFQLQSCTMRPISVNSVTNDAGNRNPQSSQHQQPTIINARQLYRKITVNDKSEIVMRKKKKKKRVEAHQEWSSGEISECTARSTSKLTIHSTLTNKQLPLHKLCDLFEIMEAN